MRRPLYFPLSLSHSVYLCLSFRAVRCAVNLELRFGHANWRWLFAITSRNPRRHSWCDGDIHRREIHTRYIFKVEFTSHKNSRCHNRKANIIILFICFTVFPLNLFLFSLFSFPLFDCILMCMERSKILRFICRSRSYLSVSPVIQTCKGKDKCMPKLDWSYFSKIFWKHAGFFENLYVVPVFAIDTLWQNL